MTRPSTRRHGSVLILVLVTVAMMALAAGTMSEMMLNENMAARVHGRRYKAEMAVESGRTFLQAFVQQDAESLEFNGGLYDNPNWMQAVAIVEDEDPRESLYFTVVSPAMFAGVTDGYRYGLEDESSRFNLNSLDLSTSQASADQPPTHVGRDQLMALPGMTESIADAILDWLDPDDTPRELGAESEYYSGLTPQYAAKNGPLERIEELLLVRGVTPELLFGRDANRNGVIDVDEGGPPIVAGIDNPQGLLDRGWSAYLTLYSQENNLRGDATPKIDINSNDLKKLHEDLVEALSDDGMANFIVAYRQYGPSAGSTTGQRAQSAESLSIATDQEAKVNLKSVLDLVGAKISIPVASAGAAEGGQAITVEAEFPNESRAMSIYLPLLMDNLSTESAETVSGRININQASRVVLNMVPQLTEKMVEDIISQRDQEVTPNQPERRHATWLLSESIATLEEMKQLLPLLTGGGDVYRAQVVGFFGQNGPAARAEIVIDATNLDSALLLWRDIGHLGRGYGRDTLGVEVDPTIDGG